MDPQRQQVIAKIKEANNVLVTVSRDPTVDQLAACIGFTLALNKMGKHATAVFSGNVPSTIEFLKPEETIEKNTDSLRDFIIAIDRSKADKLRYKVEDSVVRIFITPYKTSISDQDLAFSQGDFNVDAIVALGVHNQADLDDVITAHGRILHDATVITINYQPGGDDLGGLPLLDPSASGLSQLATEILNALDKKTIDNQIATALLTGIVAATDRFSNMQTSPKAMSISAELMTAGADQQLVALKLAEPASEPEPENEDVSNLAEDTIDFGSGQAQELNEAPTEEVTEPGTLDISHDEAELAARLGAESQQQSDEQPEPSEDYQPNSEAEQSTVDENTPDLSPAESQQSEVASTEQQPIGQPTADQPNDQSDTVSNEAPEPQQPQATDGLPPELSPQIHIDEHGTVMPHDQKPDEEPRETPKIIKEHNLMQMSPPEGMNGPSNGPSPYDDEDVEGPSGGAAGGNGFIIGAHAPGQPKGTPRGVESNSEVFEPTAQPTIDNAPAPIVITPPAAAPVSPLGGTLADLEKELSSPHALDGVDSTGAGNVPNDVAQVSGEQPELAQPPAPAPAPIVITPPAPRQDIVISEDGQLVEPAFAIPSPAAAQYNPNSPPPVPPPMMPPTGAI